MKSAVTQLDLSILGGEFLKMLYRVRRYGSYGVSSDPGFDRNVLPYLDRGMIYAIAHVRGGGEMGRYWCDRSHASRALTIKIHVLLHLHKSCLTCCYRYEEQGKYLTKRNTFQDFISCAEYLVCLGLGPGSGSGSLSVTVRHGVLGLPFMERIMPMFNCTVNQIHT